METAAYTLFDTALGRCGIAWRADAVVAFALPEADEGATAARLSRKAPGASVEVPTSAIQRGIAAVQRLLNGAPADLGFIAVDVGAAPAFERRVYEILRSVGPGETITYGALAARAGSPGAARAVGVAMARNPVPVIIPCHRVLAGGGKSGGFSAAGGLTTKFQLLAIEQAAPVGDPLLFARLPLAVRA